MILEIIIQDKLELIYKDYCFLDFFVDFLPYLQYCFCENPRGLLQFILLLYFSDHLCRFFAVFEAIYNIKI
jgi:hypothetical protein